MSFTSAKYKAQEEALKDIESNLEHIEQTYKASPTTVPCYQSKYFLN